MVRTVDAAGDLPGPGTDSGGGRNARGRRSGPGAHGRLLLPVVRDPRARRRVRALAAAWLPAAGEHRVGVLPGARPVLVGRSGRPADAHGADRLGRDRPG